MAAVSRPEVEAAGGGSAAKTAMGKKQKDRVNVLQFHERGSVLDHTSGAGLPACAVGWIT